MPNVWFTGDTHFFHKNIMEYEKRPYADVEEMNEDLIAKWNAQVHRTDKVFHLGDFTMGNHAKWRQILERLNGHIHLIIGNHDASNSIKYTADLFSAVDYMHVEKINKQVLMMTHYPMEVGLTPDVYSIHGHIHGRESNYINQINVGIDSPFTKSQVGFGNLIPLDTIMTSLPSRKDEIMRLRRSFSANADVVNEDEEVNSN